MPRKRRNNNRKRRFDDVRSREYPSLVEIEVMRTFTPKLVNEDLTFDAGENCRYREWTNLKWNRLPLPMKSAIVYHHKHQKVFALDSKLIDFLIPKRVVINDIDRDKLKGLPKSFILDLSVADNLLTVMPKENENIINLNSLSYPAAINSVLVYFEDKDGNLCEPQNYHSICMKGHYAYDPKYRHYEDAFANAHPKGHPNRHYDIARMRLFKNEDNFRVFTGEEYKEKDFSVLTLEEYKLAEIDNYCDDHEISEEARFAYSDAYLKACYDYLLSKDTGNEVLDNKMHQFDQILQHCDNYGDLRNIGISQEGLNDWIGEQKEKGRVNPWSTVLGSIRKLLLTPMIDLDDIQYSTSTKYDHKAYTLMSRRIVTTNVVLSFLKALTEEQVITSKKRSFHPLSANRKRNKNSIHPTTYSYITIDTQQLTTLRRARKSAVRRSERYQTQVEGFKAFRWVTDEKLEVDEDIFDLRENKIGTILYKVKRSITGYTRNRHLPKQKVIETITENRSVTKVKSFR